MAIDILGLEVHLDRLHAAIVANAGPDHAVIGRILAQIAKNLEKVGLGMLVDRLTDAVEKALSALPSPSGDGTDEADDDRDDDGGGRGGDTSVASSIFRKLTAPIRAAIRLAKKLFGGGGSAASSAVGAAKHAANVVKPSNGPVKKLREGKKAVDDVSDVASKATGAGS